MQISQIKLDMTDKRKGELKQLEQFLINYSRKINLLFGWVTGSTIDVVYEKIKLHSSVKCNFIKFDN